MIASLPWLLIVAACTNPGTVGTVPADDTSPGDDTGPPVDTGHAVEVISPGLAGLDELQVRNVIVVQVDTLRADHVSMYGSEHETFPEMSGRPWLVIDQMVSVTSWTIPSTVSALTALEDRHHGVTHMTPTRNFNAAVTDRTAANVFQDAGYHTAMFSGNEALADVEGLVGGFDAVEPYRADTDTVRTLRRLEDQVPAFLQWYDSLEDERPFFVWIQPMNPHSPYSPQGMDRYTWAIEDDVPFDLDAPEDVQFDQFYNAVAAAETEADTEAITTAVRAIYDENVLGVDRALAQLVSELAARGQLADTLIVLASDHGETLVEEPGSLGHGGRVRPELIHVPFALYNPQIPAYTEECLASNIDIIPTVLRAAGMEPLTGIDGHELQDGCRDIVRSSVFIQDVQASEVAEVGVRTRAGQLRWDCLNSTVYRYDLDADPVGLVPLGPEALPDREILEAGIDQLVSDISADLEPVTCTFE